MEREYSRIAVTDGMVEVLRRALGTNELGAENLMRQIIAAGGLGMVRAKGSYLSESQIAAIENGRPSADDVRQVRLTCISLASGLLSSGATNTELIERATAMASYILNGTTPTEGEG